MIILIIYTFGLFVSGVYWSYVYHSHSNDEREKLHDDIGFTIVVMFSTIFWPIMLFLIFIEITIFKLIMMIGKFLARNKSNEENKV